MEFGHYYGDSRFQPFIRHLYKNTCAYCGIKADKLDRKLDVTVINRQYEQEIPVVMALCQVCSGFFNSRSGDWKKIIDLRNKKKIQYKYRTYNGEIKCYTVYIQNDA